MFFFLIRIFIAAEDSATNSLRATETCTVTVTVFRNLHDPVFVDTPYDTTIERTAGNGFEVVKVSADDEDTYVS